MTAVSKKLPAKKQLVIPLIAVIFSLLFFCIDANAQAKITSALIKPDTTLTQSSQNDSLGFQSGRIKLNSDVHSKSGSLAMLFSALLPGAGQVYAHRYYTIPLIYGFGIYFASVAIQSNSQYMDYRGQFSESVRIDTTIAHPGDQNLLGARDHYRDQRDEFILYLGLTYFLNIIDAYVGATLFDFDVSDELGGGTKVQVRVPLH